MPVKSEATVVVVPPAPVVPSVWTPVSIVAYVGAFALFVVGQLTLAGVGIPAGISAEVQVWTGVVESIVAAVVPLAVLVSHHGVTKAALYAGVAPADAVRL